MEVALFTQQLGNATMKLRDVLRDLYAPIKGISDRTIRLYEFTLDAYGQWLGEAEGCGFREPTTADLDQLKAAKFLAWRLRNREPATASKDRAQLRALWAWCWNEQIEGVSRGPSVRRVIVPQRIPEAWLTEEFIRLLAATSGEQDAIGGVPADRWWKAILMVAYDTGERCSSLLSLKYSDVRGTLVVFRAEARKGRRNDIVRTISADTAMLLDAIAEPKRHDVFPWPYHVSTLYNRLDRILKRAGLPHDRRCKFHRIRKTTASYYEAAGGNSQALLDHSSPQVTRRHYHDPRIVRPDTDGPSLLPKVS
jgi:integrase